MKKKTIKFKTMKAGRGGWSEWVYPKLKNLYLFKCCDCGLVHEIDFKTFIARKLPKSSSFQVIELPEEIRTMFRARRMKISKKLKEIII